MDYDKKYNEALERAKRLCALPADKWMLESIFPELAESEDERIRKEILDFIQLCLSRIDFGSRSIALRKEDAEMFEKWIAYLEKQKEQKPVWKPLEESMEALLLAIEGKWDAIKPTGYMSRRLEDLYDGLVNTFNVEEAYLPKTNYTEKDIEELKTLKSKIDASIEQKPTEKQDYSVLTDFERAIHRGFLCAGVENVPVEIIKETAQDCLAHIEQKPAEWSEEFAENIRILLHDKLSGHSEDGSMSWTTLIDDKTLKDIVNGIWFYVGKEALKHPNKELNTTEWSEEDEKMIKSILFVLESYVSKSESASSPSLITTYPTYYKEIDWLKSLRPKSHWKPSDEQMGSLRLAIDSAKKAQMNATADSLNEIYEQLKKL